MKRNERQVNYLRKETWIFWFTMVHSSKSNGEEWFRNIFKSKVDERARAKEGVAMTTAKVNVVGVC